MNSKKKIREFVLLEKSTPRKKIFSLFLLFHCHRKSQTGIIINYERNIYSFAMSTSDVMKTSMLKKLSNVIGSNKT